MTDLRRWIVASGLLLTVAATAVQLWDRAPAPIDKSLNAVDVDSPSPGVPSNGRTAGELLFAAVPAQQASAASSPAASADRPAAAGVGASATMRDYGQIVITAVNGGTPRLAGKAARLIDSCQSTADLARAVDMLKSDGRLDSVMATKVTRSIDERERQCQSIPPDLVPRQKELAERALLGGERGVAMIYANLVAFDPPAAMRLPLRDALRADFLAGDTLTSLALARHADLFDLSRIETRAYEIAFDTQNARMKDALNAGGFVKPTPALSDDEQRQAEGLAQAWLGSVKKPQAPEDP